MKLELHFNEMHAKAKWEYIASKMADLEIAQNQLVLELLEGAKLMEELTKNFTDF
jgi:hypothetical protein